MENLWNAEQAQSLDATDLALRVYSSNLLGQSDDLVLHGGGNASVKSTCCDVFGQQIEIIYVKGSGCDLKTMVAKDFTPLELSHLQRLATLDDLSDGDMVREINRAMLDIEAPHPSLETILHAVIPYKFVDHTHADAIVTISNSHNGLKRLQSVYGSGVLILPYAKPGFALAKQVFEAIKEIDLDALEGIILSGHGVFTFAEVAKASYDNMIALVNKAEAYLKAQNAWETPCAPEPMDIKAEDIASLRAAVSKSYGKPMVVKWLQDASFAALGNVKALTHRGLLTPDHAIRTKPFAMVVDEDIHSALRQFEQDYDNYFKEFAGPEHIKLDSAPRMVVFKNRGRLSCAQNIQQSKMVSDIFNHTAKAIQRAEKLGGWHPACHQHLFELEYWSLEQAKLKQTDNRPMFEGKVALVTGAAGGIGKACVRELLDLGACVIATDINPTITETFADPGYLGLVCDITNSESVKLSIEQGVKHFGGIDMLVSNAGTFPKNSLIEEMDEDGWERSLNINLSGHMRVIKYVTPYLKQGFDPSIVIVASKNVPAPGPGAAAYSSAKAGLTQLSRVAALELAKFGIRVNIIHPNAVFDTELWTEELLASRAANYGMTVDEYKRNNLLKTEITSKNVAELVAALSSHAFAKTTAAQVPIDGGNERVI